MKLACDLHTHSLYSKHAYSTVLENAHAAAEAGIEVLGITDHYSAMINATQDVREFQFFMNTVCWPKEYEGVRLLHGAEADIVDMDGHLFGWDIELVDNIAGAPYKEPMTLEKKALTFCDYVIASVHNKSFTSETDIVANTEMYMHALDHPKVLFLGHIGRSGVKIDYRELLAYAKEKHKFIEINNASFDRSCHVKKCRKIAEFAAEIGTKICVNTDAHIATAVGVLDDAQRMLEEIDFPQELIVTSSKESLYSAAADAGFIF